MALLHIAQTNRSRVSLPMPGTKQDPIVSTRNLPSCPNYDIDYPPFLENPFTLPSLYQMQVQHAGQR